MLRRMSERIVGWQIEKGTLTETDREVYLYGYEVLLNQVINVAIAALLAIILRSPIQIIVFLVGYIPLRSYSGGYHADSNLGCSVVSAMLIFVVCLASEAMHGTPVALMSLAAFGVSGLLIFKIAPVPDKNKPLDDLETARYRLRSRMIWAVEVFAGTILVIGGWRAGIVLTLSHAILSLMLCLGLLKNLLKKKKYN